MEAIGALIGKIIARATSLAATSDRVFTEEAGRQSGFIGNDPGKDGRAPEDARPQGLRKRHGEEVTTFTLAVDDRGCPSDGPGANAEAMELTRRTSAHTGRVSDVCQGSIGREPSDQLPHADGKKCSVTNGDADRATRTSGRRSPTPSG